MGRVDATHRHGRSMLFVSQQPVSPAQRFPCRLYESEGLPRRFAVSVWSTIDRPAGSEGLITCLGTEPNDIVFPLLAAEKGRQSLLQHRDPCSRKP